MEQLNRSLSLLFAAVLLLASCGPAAGPAVQQDQFVDTSELDLDLQPVDATPTPAVEPPAPQPHDEPVNYGPNPEDFPTGINPLTGEPVGNPDALDLPAVLISITNFPPSARPQAGLSFSPMVFEIYITQGMTRFLAAFYGDFPKRESAPAGGCDVRGEAFTKTDQVIGNRAWWDANGDGIQDAGEESVGGMCVRLFDAASHGQVASTTTDANGFYGFNVPAGGQYYLQFVLPKGFAFTSKNVGSDEDDSDVDPATGKTDAFNVGEDDLSWDAGIREISNEAVFVDPPAPKGKEEVSSEVGPVRSGRLPYAHIRDFFQGSCLVYASASPDVAARLRGCQMVYGQDSHDINSAMLDVTRMEDLAEKNKNENQPFNYTGNVFSSNIPAGGAPVSDLAVFYSFLNQSKWSFDPLAGAWLRYTDKADGSGAFVPDTDRLTGKQIYFDNVIVLFAAHDVESRSKVDIELGIGNKGTAYLFRDGMVYKIRWSTIAGDYEKSTGLRRPIQFTDEAGNPVALKPGHTWVHVMTPFSYVQEKSPGQWKARFYAPAGAD